MTSNLRHYKSCVWGRLQTIGLLSCVAAAIASLPAAAAAGPQRVMSLSMCTDALLLELLPLERITSVTYLSRAPSNSFLWPRAAKVAINYGNAEEVFAQKPDLVLAGTYTTPAARMVLKRSGIPILEVPPANNFDEIRVTTRRVAHALGQEEVGEKLIAKMDATLRELDATKPRHSIRVAGWNGGGAVPGRGTLFDAILTAAGGVNIAASDGEYDGTFDLEQLLQARPDVLAFGSDTSSTPSLHTDQALHPLILKLYAGRRLSYPSVLYSCGLVESADAAVALRAGLLNVMRGGG
jgi:iron complex transport system substrate-binding protein